jgi:hypothetical protein
MRIGIFHLPIAMPFFSFIGTTAAIIGGSLLAAGGSIAGAAINSSAQDDALSAGEKGQREALAAQERLAREGIAYQERQANSSLDFLKQQYQDAQGQLKPYGEIQLDATKQLAGFQDANNPIYQQQRDRMTQAIQQQLAAQGLLRSGRQTASLTDLELGLNQQRLGVSQGLAGLGAAQNSAGLSQQYGGQVAGIQQGLGQSVGSSLSGIGGAQAQSATNLAQLQAQRIQAGAQNTSSLIGGLTNIGSNALGAFAQNDPNSFQNRLLKSLGGGQQQLGFGAFNNANIGFTPV